MQVATLRSTFFQVVRNVCWCPCNLRLTLERYDGNCKKCEQKLHAFPNMMNICEQSIVFFFSSVHRVPEGPDHEQLESPSWKPKDARRPNVSQCGDHGRQTLQCNRIDSRVLCKSVSYNCQNKKTVSDTQKCIRKPLYHRSTAYSFNPKPANPSILSHALLDLLVQISPVFKRNFSALLKKR